MSSSSNRMWVGPLLLVLVIALIYVFSLMPNGPPHRSRFASDELMSSPSHDYELHNRMHESLDVESLPYSVCLNGGTFNETTEICDCAAHFAGNKCEVALNTVCLNGGFFSPKHNRCRCHMPWTGVNCQFRCSGGYVNRTNWSCQCPPKFFGPSCQLLCFNGEVIDGYCMCRKGFTGQACVTCDPSYYTSGECDPTTKRRGAVNSRLTLSGLSFCMITIGLLCVTARRRRNALLPPSEDTWYRVFHPQPDRSRCRHQFACGGSWIPRDRALIVSPGRAALSHGRSSGSATRAGLNRATTPPPNYTSVDNLAEDQAPPTYEEATHTDTAAVLIDETQENKDETTETQTTRETEE